MVAVVITIISVSISIVNFVADWRRASSAEIPPGEGASTWRMSYGYWYALPPFPEQATLALLMQYQPEIKKTGKP